jgi:hypothetical protein
MPASENTEIVETTTSPARNACLTAGCSCRDARIVSYRRAAFYASVAGGSGETADRVVPAEPGWRFPAVVAAGLDLLLPQPDGLEAPVLLAELSPLPTATLSERNDR